VKTKTLTAAATALVLVMSLGSTAFACGDGSCEPPTEPEKGNNGWGNGADTTNSGSFSGATKDTKSVNGPATDKFTGR
jgi:hypothetical protein